jgi:hypothetical protein
MPSPVPPRRAVARTRIRLITALVAGTTLAAGTLGATGAANATSTAAASTAPTVPSRPSYTFGSAGTSVFGESWKASDHPVPGGTTAATASGHTAQSALLNYASFSVNFLSHLTLNTIDEKTLTSTDAGTLRQQMAGALALDSVHHVALIAYASPQPLSIFGHPGGVLTDSNSRSQIDVVDTTTGKVLKTLTAFEFTHGFGGPLSFTAEPDIQIDPATRTGFTYGPGWSQIEQFSY